MTQERQIAGTEVGDGAGSTGAVSSTPAGDHENDVAATLPEDLLRLMGDTLAAEFSIQRLLVVDPAGPPSVMARAISKPPCRP